MVVWWWRGGRWSMRGTLRWGAATDFTTTKQALTFVPHDRVRRVELPPDLGRLGPVAREVAALSIGQAPGGRECELERQGTNGLGSIAPSLTWSRAKKRTTPGAGGSPRKKAANPRTALPSSLVLLLVLLLPPPRRQKGKPGGAIADCSWASAMPQMRWANRPAASVPVKCGSRAA